MRICPYPMKSSAGISGTHESAQALRRRQPPISWACRRNYGKVERGERTVNLERLVQISHLYGTTVCALLEGFDTEAAAPVTQRPAEMDAFLSAMREIAGGCTEQSRALMLRVCAEIAAIDKN